MGIVSKESKESLQPRKESLQVVRVWVWESYVEEVPKCAECT